MHLQFLGATGTVTGSKYLLRPDDGAGGSVLVSCGPAAGGAFFEVADDGPGIPAADLPHVLEPFYRPDTSRSRATGGSGLGLAIVRAAAEAHGGHVTVSSVEGRGTVVRLHLPANALTKA